MESLAKITRNNGWRNPRWLSGCVYAKIARGPVKSGVRALFVVANWEQ
jgi:hypothetical protein